MFEFLDRDNHERGSQDRYSARPRHPWWWFVHNCIAHPLIGIAPVKPFFDFHDYTSRKINKIRFTAAENKQYRKDLRMLKEFHKNKDKQ